MANVDYTNHSKFVYKNYDEIQDSINSSELNAWDLILCKDTKEFLLIKEDLSLAPIKSKIYRYVDIESAEKQLNTLSDTYAGQIVAVLNEKTGCYEAYIVNQKINGQFKLDPLNIYTGSIDYDTLSHRPIINVESDDISAPVVLDTLKEGFYKVNGSYKISDSIDTVFSSYSSNLFWVHHGEDGTVYVKRIGATDITDYVINVDGTYSVAIVPTTEWLKEQGYVTEPYIDAKIAALDFVNKTEIEEYVQNVVLQQIDTIVNERIELAINDKFMPTTDKEIIDIFQSK